MFEWPSSRVSNIENGRATITGHVLTALARAYRCSVPDLLGRDPGPQTAILSLHGGLPQGGPGFAALTDALAALSRLATEIQVIRDEVLPRLKTLESEVAEAAGRITEALRDAEALAETFERAAGSLRAVPLPAEGSAAAKA